MTTYAFEPSFAPNLPAAAQPSGPETEGTGEAAQLFTHAKRPEWGLAIRVRQRDGRIDYQFQDGAMRAIAAAYDHHMVTVDRPADETATALRELTALSGLTLARGVQAEGADGGRLITLDEQVEQFVSQYPDGFEDARWKSRVRGIDQRRRTKAHRDAAIAGARTLLVGEAFEQLFVEQQYEEILARAKQALQETNLVTNAQLRPLSALAPNQLARFAEALRSVLYGTEDWVLSFTKLLQVFRHADAPLSWPVATAWAALIWPELHVCVRPSSFVEQARWMAPTLSIPKQPDAQTYLRLREMALTIQQELEKRDLRARDLLDIYDFIWCTLRPAARKEISARPPSPRESEVRQTAGDEAPMLEATGTDGP